MEFCSCAPFNKLRSCELFTLPDAEVIGSCELAVVTTGLLVAASCDPDVIGSHEIAVCELVVVGSCDSMAASCDPEVTGSHEIVACELVTVGSCDPVVTGSSVDDPE